MLNITGNFSNRSTDSILSHKEELHRICNKILDGCTRESLRFAALNMRAIILEAEGKNEEAHKIRFSLAEYWQYNLDELHANLFAKNTKEHYFCAQVSTCRFSSHAGDAFGRMLVDNLELSTYEKANKAISCVDAMIDSFKKTGEAFFLIQASEFIGVVEFLLCVPLNVTDEQLIAVVDRSLYVKKQLMKFTTENKALNCGFFGKDTHFDLFEIAFNAHLNAKSGRLAELLKNPKYKAVLDKYID
jgi:hypothetical protein